MAGQMLTALTLENATGEDVNLMQDPERKITKASGLSGINVRELVKERAGRRGSRNMTRYRSDSAIVFEGTLIGGNADDTWYQYDTIAGAFAEAVDTDRLLKWTAGSALRLQQRVQLSSFEGPLEVGPDLIRYQVAFRATDPNIYSQDEYSAESTPLGTGTGGGLIFPFTFPVVLNPPVSTAAFYTNQGFIATPAIFTLYGYLSNPIIRLSPGVELVIDGEIADSDRLVIDVDKRKVTLITRAGELNRRSMLNTVASTWFDLPRGSGTVTLLASLFSPGSKLTMRWRDARE